MFPEMVVATSCDSWVFWVSTAVRACQATCVLGIFTIFHSN